MRPHPLSGIVTVPDDAEALILVCSTTRRRETAALVAALEQDADGPGLAVALFDDLLPAQSRSEPLSLFDSNVLAARVTAAIDALTSDAELRALPLGCLAMGDGTASAVIAGSERPHAISALVLLDGSLVAASTSLPGLQAPTLLLRSGSDRQEDGGFLATGGSSRREVRRLTAPAIRTGTGLLLASGQARRWFERHLLGYRGRSPA